MLFKSVIYVNSVFKKKLQKKYAVMGHKPFEAENTLKKDIQQKRLRR